MLIETQSQRSASPTGAALHHSGEETNVEIVNAQFNGYQVVRNAEGKFGIQDLANPESVSFRYRSRDLAEQTAQSLSNEQDQGDAYENEHGGSVRCATVRKIYLPLARYEDRETVKSHGAQYDGQRKRWYVVSADLPVALIQFFRA